MTTFKAGDARYPSNKPDLFSDPAVYFETPFDVLKGEGLTFEERLEILTVWKTNENALMKLSKRNLKGERAPVLAALNEAICEAEKAITAQLGNTSSPDRLAVPLAAPRPMNLEY